MASDHERLKRLLPPRARRALAIATAVAILGPGAALASSGSSPDTAGLAPAVSALVSPVVHQARRLTGTVPALVSVATRIGAADPRLKLHLVLPLALPDQAALDRFVQDEYTPGNPSYHAFLDPASFAARFGAPAAEVDRAMKGLRALGISAGAPTANHLFISADTTVATAEKIFGVGIANFRLPTGSLFRANVGDITMPAPLVGDITGVIGLDDSARPQPHLRTRASSPGAQSGLPLLPAAVAGLLGHPATTPAATPHSAAAKAPAAAAPTPAQPTHQIAPVGVSGGATPCLQAVLGAAYTAPDLAAAYNFNGLYSAGFHGEGMSAALVEFDDYHDSNVAAVKSCYGLKTNVVRRLVNGGTGGPPVGAEAEDMADISVLLEMLPKLENLYVYVAPITGFGELELYNTFVTDHKAPVISASWGNCEALNSQADNRLLSVIAEEAAAQGQQILTASGDSGAVDCRGFPPPTGGSINVEQEAAVPWITGVGGTNLGHRATVPGLPRDETTWNDNGAGGGGVSSLFTMPSWQRALPSAVTAPGHSGAPCGAPAGQLCREVPDISADASPSAGVLGRETNPQFVDDVGSLGYSIYCATSNCALPALLLGPLPGGIPNAPFGIGGWEPIGGTSLSTPLTAAAAVLWDQKARAGGLSGVGFLNPALYRIAADPAKYATDYHDITTDSNSAQYDTGDCPAGCNPGHLYPAVAGYDLATGLGSYDATKLGADMVADAGRTVVTPDTATVYGYLHGPATTTPVSVGSGYPNAAYTVATDVPWLHAAVGSMPGTLNWSADPKGLSAGTRTGHITVTGRGGPATLTVTYQVTPRAAIAVSATSLHFAERSIDTSGKTTAASCGATTWNDELKSTPQLNGSGDTTPVDASTKQTLVIGNAGAAASILHWSAFFLSSSSGWLSADLQPTGAKVQTAATHPIVATEGAVAAGGSPSSLALVSLANGNALGGYPRLNAGTYHGVVQIHDLADPSASTNVPVTLVLAGSSKTPTVAVAPRAISATVAHGSTTTVSLSLTDPSDTCGYTYSVASDSDWASIDPHLYSGTVGAPGQGPSGADPTDTAAGNGKVPVTVDATGLAPGVHHAMLTVQSENAEPNPVTVPVTVTVT